MKYDKSSIHFNIQLIITHQKARPPKLIEGRAWLKRIFPPT